MRLKAFGVLTVLVLLSLAGLGSESASGAATTQIKLLSVAGWRGQVEPLTVGGASVGGSAALSAYWAAERDAGTLTLSTGNALGMSPPISNLFNDEPAIFAMNEMGFDVDTFGNDNFDHGVAYLQRLTGLAQFDFVAANLVNAEANLRGVQPYRIYDLRGVKVAVIGVMDPVSPTRVFPGNFGNMQVSDPRLAAVAAREAASKAGAQVFVLITELTIGSTDPGVGGPTGGLLDLAAGLQGFDAILGASDGGDYSTYVNGALVVANQGKGATFARTTLSFDADAGNVVDKKVTFVQPKTSAVTPDPQIEALVANYRAQLAGRLTQVIATSQTEAPQADACGQADGRTCESVPGDFLADAMRVSYGTDFALTNSGGIRAGLTCPTVDSGADFCPAFQAPPYPVTEGEVEAMLPFGNIAVIVNVTGAELRAMLENGVSSLPLAEGRFPQVSGLCFVYDLGQAIGARVQSVSRQAPDGGCGGEALDLSAKVTYSLATNDFVAAGGDGYARPAAAGVSREPLVNLLSAYLSTHGNIAPVLQGRIACVSSGSAACAASSAPAGSPGTVRITAPRTGDGGLADD